MKTLLTTLLLLIAATLYSQTSGLIVKIHNIKEKRGVIRVFLWKGADGFPKEKGKFFRADSVLATSDSVRIFFEDIPEGNYAVSLFQDINGNREFDKNRFAQTTEPFGLSGKPDFSERPVKYDDCSFKISDTLNEVHISLMYKEDIEKFR